MFKTSFPGSDHQTMATGLFHTDLVSSGYGSVVKTVLRCVW